MISSFKYEKYLSSQGYRVASLHIRNGWVTIGYNPINLVYLQLSHPFVWPPVLPDLEEQERLAREEAERQMREEEEAD